MLGRQTINFDLSWYSRSFLRKLAAQATRNAQQRAARQAQGAGATEAVTLFVADTRPALTAGLPHMLATALLMALGESIVIVGPLWCWWVVVPYLVLRLLIRQDYNAPRVATLWLASKAADLQTGFWYGASPSSFPLHETKYPRGIW